METTWDDFLGILKKIASAVFLITFFWGATPAFAQNAIETPAGPIENIPNTKPNISTPEGVIMPWRTVGIDPSLRAKLTQGFLKTQNFLEQQILKNSETLTQFLVKKNARNLTSNIKRRSNKIKVGDLKKPYKTPLAIEPVLCSLSNQYIVFLTVTHSTQNLLLASSHIAIDKRELVKKIRAKTIEGWVKTKATELLNSVLQKLNNTAPKDNALKLGFSNEKPNNRADEGSPLCLNMLLSESLTPKYRIVRSIGNESIVSFRRLIKPKKRMQRATRRIINRWEFPSRKGNEKSTFPIELSLTSTYADSVFATHLPGENRSAYKFTKNRNGKINFEIDPKFAEFIAQEKESLELKSPAKISRVYRGWVYLDKGRAWGLRMNDRIVIQEEPTEIKGHVIGYYGPEMKLKSPSGYDIREGAIVFIRKGQRKTRIGQTAVFDRRRYPTNWPPTPPK